MAAMGTGFIAMLAEAIFGGAFGFGKPGLSAPLASLIAAALAIVSGIGVSLYLRRPAKIEADYREEMRDPEGETIYDRAQMRAAASAAASAAMEPTG
jgi:hypothetical protein